MRIEQKYKIIHARTNSCLASDMQLASSFSQRLVGLMFKKQMGTYDALLLDPCNSIHTFFMNFSIDALFLDSSNRIVKLYKNLKPWKMTCMSFRTKKVLELKAGVLTEDIKEGDEVIIECLN